MLLPGIVGKALHSGNGESARRGLSICQPVSRPSRQTADWQIGRPPNFFGVAKLPKSVRMDNSPAGCGLIGPSAALRSSGRDKLVTGLLPVGLSMGANGICANMLRPG